MADAPRRLLLDQIGVSAVFFVVEIGIDVHLAYVVEEVEIEVVHAAPFELRLEDLLRLPHVGKVIPGELACKIKFVARVGGQNAPDARLRFPVVVAPCGVEVVDAVRDGIVEHLRRQPFVHLAVVAVQNRQAHRAEPECRQLFALKLPVDHNNLLILP